MPDPLRRRYIMQPVDGGILRLDTETGAMSMCAKRGAAYSCEPVQDDRSSQKDLERLTAENRDLRGEIKRMEEIMGLGGTPGGAQPVPPTGPRTGQAGRGQPHAEREVGDVQPPAHVVRHVRPGHAVADLHRPGVRPDQRDGAEDEHPGVEHPPALGRLVQRQAEEPVVARHPFDLHR